MLSPTFLDCVLNLSSKIFISSAVYVINVGQVENLEISETSEISEIFSRFFLFRLFDFGPIFKSGNSEEENSENNFRRFRRFRRFRVFNLTFRQIEFFHALWVLLFSFLILFEFVIRLLHRDYPTCKSMFKLARIKSNVYYICSNIYSN